MSKLQESYVKGSDASSAAPASQKSSPPYDSAIHNHVRAVRNAGPRSSWSNKTIKDLENLKESMETLIGFLRKDPHNVKHFAGKNYLHTLPIDEVRDSVIGDFKSGIDKINSLIRTKSDRVKWPSPSAVPPLTRKPPNRNSSADLGYKHPKR